MYLIKPKAVIAILLVPELYGAKAVAANHKLRLIFKAVALAAAMLVMAGVEVVTVEYTGLRLPL